MKKHKRLRPAPLYITLACGIVCIVFGLFLSIQEKNLQGNTHPDKYGNPGGEIYYIQGWWIMLIGLTIAIYPALQLTKKPGKK